MEEAINQTYTTFYWLFLTYRLLVGVMTSTTAVCQFYLIKIYESSCDLVIRYTNDAVLSSLALALSSAS